MKIHAKILLLVCAVCGFCPVSGQPDTYKLHGIVKDSVDGQKLVGAGVWLVGEGPGTATGADGTFLMELEEGEYTIQVTHLGYRNFLKEINLDRDLFLEIAMTPAPEKIGTVTVRSAAANANVTATGMGVERMSSDVIRTIPALMGEVDILKAIQLLPGVQGTSEGTTGFSVRGGSHDQNLILLDDATLYNASHLLGFFSVFNNDAVRDVTLYKGDIPANFGGRLSSLLDVRTKTGGVGKFSGSGGIGIIASRATLEGPLGNSDHTYLISGRRTYADLFLKLSGDRDLRNSTLYFYDANLKLNNRLGDNNTLNFSAYIGRDKFGTSFAGMDFGNKTATLQWKNYATRRLTSEVALTFNRYDYYLGADLTERINQYWKSSMDDYGLKAGFVWDLGKAARISFGGASLLHSFRPGDMCGKGDDPSLARITLPRQYSIENGLYISAESGIGSRLKLKYGLRYSVFNNLGNGHATDILDAYEPVETVMYKKGKIYNTYSNPEPRLGLVLLLGRNNSLKASYARTVQYIQVASNSAAGSPLDVWFQSSKNILPQYADQYSAGYFRNFADDRFEFSAEAYYKHLRNVIDFKDHADLLVNEHLEREVRMGKGYAYGVELMLRRNEGRLQGWVSYTYARSYRTTEGINGGKQYRSPYDKPHNISTVITFKLNGKWELAVNWLYSTGTPVSYPTGKYLIGSEYVPLYSGRNQHRYPDYHRLDVAATLDLTKPGRKVRSELNFSLYNAYGRKNPWMIRFKSEEDSPNDMYAEQVYLFSVVPSITWNFYF